MTSREIIRVRWFDITEKNGITEKSLDGISSVRALLAVRETTGTLVFHDSTGIVIATTIDDDGEMETVAFPRCVILSTEVISKCTTTKQD